MELQEQQIIMVDNKSFCKGKNELEKIIKKCGMSLIYTVGNGIMDF